MTTLLSHARRGIDTERVIKSDLEDARDWTVAIVASALVLGLYMVVAAIDGRAVLGWAVGMGGSP